MTTQKLIERGWKSYRHRVIPVDAPDIQIKECRQAFYAGAAILFHVLRQSLSEGDEPEDSDIQRFQDVHDELETFSAELDKRYLNIRSM